jgi:1,4-alpha-glucan branching enzyme
VVFRINAPQAMSVRLNGSDIPGNLGPGAEMMKAENGVWEVTLGPIDPGAYRYNFNVDRVSVIDPKNPSTSESNNNVWSMVYVPGADFMDLQNAPHGAVAAVNYYSSTLKKWRRMHVYTPRRRATNWAKANIRSFTCFTEPAIVTSPGPRSARPDSSWTT